MREIKFRASLDGREYDIWTLPPFHKSQGYVYRRVNHHPFMTSRGYVREQRLIIEQHLGRFLQKKEFIHHIDGNRDNNELSNLKLYDGQSTHAKGHSKGERNPNGRFVASDQEFENIKFRLLNTNTGTIEVYTLSELIGKTFRRGQFKFRGRSTGLHDSNGKEIFGSDLWKLGDETYLIVWCKGDFQTGWKKKAGDNLTDIGKANASMGEVIGNIWENGIY